MAKIAVAEIARGDGWFVSDVVCTSGPEDRPFEEEHARDSIAIVVRGTFQVRSMHARELMTPGSLMLGRRGQSFQCAHDHGRGDRCILFSFDGAFYGQQRQKTLRLPPLRELAPFIARAAAGLHGAETPWEELAIELATATLRLTSNVSASSGEIPRGAEGRVARTVRAIDEGVDTSLASLAKRAGLSPYHFLRVFERLTGLTPHQYILRARLREAAVRLASNAKIVDVALDSGFGDVSNFNRAFRREFGMSPRAYRKAGDPGRDRTYDQLVKSQLLYH